MKTCIRADIIPLFILAACSDAPPRSGGDAGAGIEQKEVIVGTNPIGPEIPAFVVHSARASVVVFQTRHDVNELALRIENISNRLYAEFPNATFFRPEPERTVSLALLVRF
ncbi:MAG: hypothetical protein H0T48_08330 [Gemmatimonadaceae bacterium]|nr:hypothetical protein [Gemmatimonadaceae bacterium]